MTEKKHAGTVVGMRLNHNILEAAEQLRTLLGKDFESYPSGDPSRAEVLRVALVRGLKAMSKEK